MTKENKGMIVLLRELDKNDELTKEAIVKIKLALVTAKEEMIFRGSQERGQAMKQVENAIELSSQLIKCYTIKPKN